MAGGGIPRPTLPGVKIHILNIWEGVSCPDRESLFQGVLRKGLL